VREAEIGAAHRSYERGGGAEIGGCFGSGGAITDRFSISGEGESGGSFDRGKLLKK